MDKSGRMPFPPSEQAGFIGNSTLIVTIRFIPLTVFCGLPNLRAT